MSDDQFTNLFKYMEKRFEALEKGQAELKAELKADINRVYNLVDQDLKRRETEEHERQVMNHELDRHEEWIGRASKQVDVSYEH